MSKKATKGILLVQLGTPDSPATSDVRKYLTEFLMDGRVIDIPYINRTLLVRGIIAPTRAPKSAKIYETIWDKETGSPLMHYSIIQRDLLQKSLGEDYHVELAMRYQNPSIENALKNMEGMLLDSIRVIPLFPQYASATSGSVIERVMELIRKWNYLPNMSFVSSYCQEPLMIETFADHARQHDIAHFDHIVFSYHGLPVRQLGKVDPTRQLSCPEDGCDSCKNTVNSFCYLSQCHATTRAIAQELGLENEQYSICFQSRLGKEPWIQPYTSSLLEDLAQKGKKKLLVFSPAFVADCIETIDEIGVEYANEFKHLGGEEVQLVESLNGDPKWIEALKRLALNA